jgi:tRNA G37 N-methylase Trm5
LNDESQLLCLPITAEGFAILSAEARIEGDIGQRDLLFACLRHCPAVRNNRVVSPRSKLIAELESVLELTLTDKLLEDVPSTWQKIGDAIILPNTCFLNPLWQTLGDRLWAVVAKSLSGSKVAVGNEILPDQFRTPKLKLVLGDSSWVKHKENGITYCLDVTKSMFASGNTTERMRMGLLDCRGETVLDLYAGVGYFVLPFLIHAKADFVHACEWNPYAVEGLRRGLEENGGDLCSKCAIHFGDNREVAPVGVADRVNLGLIPSSEEGWLVACRALKPECGGWMHVHGCVSSKDCPGGKRSSWDGWGESVKTRICELLKHTHRARIWTVTVSSIVHVKPYAPHIDHIVVDLECRPFCS